MAVWFEFTADFDHRPHPSQVTAYRAGGRYFLPQTIADEAVAKGAGSIIPKPDDLKSTKGRGVQRVNPAPDPAPASEEK